MSREFCPDQSKIDNLRCVHFEEEIESCYGRQLWYFEAMGVDGEQKRHRLFGALEFSVQYGLLEACKQPCSKTQTTGNGFSMRRLSPFEVEFGITLARVSGFGW